MYNYRQHDLSEATARALESAEARINALEAELRATDYGGEWELLWDALDKAWDAFRRARSSRTRQSATYGAFLL